MMSVYGRRCLGMVREGCKGTVKLEVCCMMGAELTSSTRIRCCTISCCTFNRYSTPSERCPRFGVPVDSVGQPCLGVADVSRGEEGIGDCKPKHAEPTRRSGRQIPRPQWQAIRRHERIVRVHGEDQDLESLYWDPVLYAYGLLLLNETKSSAQLDLTSDQVRQVRNGERVLQTSLDSSLLVLRPRPPA